MGHIARESVRRKKAAIKVSHVMVALVAIAPVYLINVSVLYGATPDLRAIRGEISMLEKDLLQSRENHASASAQVKKIKRLVALQKKEIEFSKKRVQELGTSLVNLSARKQELVANIATQKSALKRKLRELNKLTENESLDASWIKSIDRDNQKAYFLSKTLQKDLVRVSKLKSDVAEALALELKIIDERNKVDYYVQELSGQISLLSSNEGVYKEIITTNRASRLEALEKMRSLKESEQALEKTLSQHTEIAKPAPVITPPVSALSKDTIEVSLAALKGKLPFPADGNVLSGFGKSFNSKTNLLTFQKGITIGVRPSSAVRAVAPGKVVFSGPLKNYGQIVILEHRGQYFSLYGQLGRATVASGATIQQGDTVGQSSGEPLYFEIRNRNVAVNPVQWLANGAITLTKH